MIQNPTPITANTFSGMWITNLGVFLPTTEKPKGFIGGNLLPFDGQHLLSTGGQRLFVGDIATARTTDSNLNAMLIELTTEVKRQAGKTVEPKFVAVNAPDPSKKVSAQIQFTDESFYRIPDCFTLCETDSTFAAVFQNVMAQVARLAGLTVA